MSSVNISNSQLVVLAVAELGGSTRYVHPEDVALRVDQIAPGKFRWKKFHEFIDIHLVKKALQDTKRKYGKEGPMLIGDNTKGWMLAQVGQEWYEQTGERLFADRGQFEVNRKLSIRADQEAERARMRNTKAYQLYLAGKVHDINLVDFRHFVRINEYFLSNARARRFALVDNAVFTDSELADLWNQLKVSFVEEMT